jgi:hypothetical protein
MDDGILPDNLFRRNDNQPLDITFHDEGMFYLPVSAARTFFLEIFNGSGSAAPTTFFPDITHLTMWYSGFHAYIDRINIFPFLSLTHLAIWVEPELQNNRYKYVTFARKAPNLQCLVLIAEIWSHEELYELRKIFKNMYLIEHRKEYNDYYQDWMKESVCRGGRTIWDVAKQWTDQLVKAHPPKPERQN